MRYNCTYITYINEKLKILLTHFVLKKLLNLTCIPYMSFRAYLSYISNKGVVLKLKATKYCCGDFYCVTIALRFGDDSLGLHNLH